MDRKIVVGYTTGVYDMFHIGHLNIIKRAKEQCDYLIVGVTSDELCKMRKNKQPIICQEERKSIVSAIKYVDLVVDQNDMDKMGAFYKFHFDKVFVGDDWKGTKAWIDYEKQFSEVGVEVVYLPHTDGISSTQLRERIGLQ
jgi:glycerol-3-phosphate cytidylyltransferase